jgi:hypothetical protein
VKTFVTLLILSLALPALAFPAQADCAPLADLDVPGPEGAPPSASAAACAGPDAAGVSLEGGTSRGFCATSPAAPPGDYASACASAEGAFSEDASLHEGIPAEPTGPSVAASALAQACLGNAESEACDGVAPPPAERIMPTVTQRLGACLGGLGSDDCADFRFAPPLGGVVTITLRENCGGCQRWSVTATPGWTCTETHDALALLATCTPLQGNSFTCRNFQVWGEARSTAYAQPSQIVAQTACGGASTFCIASSNENLGACQNHVYTDELQPPLTCYLRATSAYYLTTGTAICYNDP